MIRFLDFILALVGLIALSPILFLLCLVGYFDTRSPLFCQIRVGRNQRAFVLVKFRSMKVKTPSVASHLAGTAAITPYGRFLRRTKLDELPQLWNVLKGEMSLVGPRPGLFNQYELTKERSSRGVFEVRPGITGLAQLNRIDMSTPTALAETDQRMVRSLSVNAYFKYIFLTLVGKGFGDAIK